MEIASLINELHKLYLGPNGLESQLENTGVVVLKDFLENWENILKFNKKYYKKEIPKIVICGINPGRLGSGKTGIPFIDQKSLSKLIPDIKGEDAERSAQFFFEIVENFGAEKFYKSFYVTNISWLGFVKNKKNFNYYDLPESVKLRVFDFFKMEMDMVKPKMIISLSQAVHDDLNKLFAGTEINTEIVLAHPNYCAFPKNRNKYKRNYIEVLGKNLP